jgi:hypothetical protein
MNSTRFLVIIMKNLHDIEISDTSKYRLIGTSVLSYRFAVPHDDVVYVGDILKIADTKKDCGCKMGYAPPRGALLRAWGGRISYCGSLSARVCRCERVVQEGEDDPHQILPRA